MLRTHIRTDLANRSPAPFVHGPAHANHRKRRAFPRSAALALASVLLFAAACASHSHAPEEAEATLRLDVERHGTWEHEGAEYRITDAWLAVAHLDFVVVGSAEMARVEGAPLGSRLAGALDGWFFRSAHAHPGHDHGPQRGDIISVERKVVLQAGADEELVLPLVVARYDGMNVGWRTFGEDEVTEPVHVGFSLVLAVESGEDAWMVGVEMDSMDHTDDILFDLNLRGQACALTLHLNAAPEDAPALLEGWEPPAEAGGIVSAPESLRFRVMDPAYWAMSTDC